MLSRRDCTNIASGLYDLTYAYLSCKKSMVKCMHSQTPVRASNLYAALILLEKIEGIIYPPILTEAVRNQAMADAQLAFTSFRGRHCGSSPQPEGANA